MSNIIEKMEKFKSMLLNYKDSELKEAWEELRHLWENGEFSKDYKHVKELVTLAREINRSLNITFVERELLLEMSRRFISNL
jgi:hypothetical protein